MACSLILTWEIFFRLSKCSFSKMYRCVWTLLCFPQHKMHCICWGGSKSKFVNRWKRLNFLHLGSETTLNSRGGKKNHFFKKQMKNSLPSFYVTYGWLSWNENDWFYGLWALFIQNTWGFSLCLKAAQESAAGSFEQWWLPILAATQWSKFPILYLGICLLDSISS